MEQLKKSMIQRARRQYKQIYPCVPKRSLQECFTTYGDEVSFWFNTADKSTRLIVCKMPA
ncbi:MAG: hypothetical protein FWB85_02320 [Chitinispirillia bacterium]|nr:hypothetical protein [Chitinispirillia bacterium]MCL2241240.1 hypothetical protein [Chitinispirillia bacterium]